MGVKILQLDNDVWKKTIHHQQMPIQPFILPKKPICSPLKNKTKLAACIAATLTNTAEQYHWSQNGTKKKLQNQPETIKVV